MKYKIIKSMAKTVETSVQKRRKWEWSGAEQSKFRGKCLRIFISLRLIARISRTTVIEQNISEQCNLRRYG